MKKTFALNTEPHVAEIPGVADLEFLPEVTGDEYLDAYKEMRDAGKRDQGVDMDELDGVSPETLRAVAAGLRLFLSRLMLPESAALLTRVDVVKAGKVLKSFDDWEAAQAYADGVKGGGAKPVWGLRLPDRVLVDLLTWTVELYTGGRRPPTSRGASAKPSSKGGMRSTGASRSKGSTRTAGRSAAS